MPKKQIVYCYLCGRHPIGYGEIYLNGNWHNICGNCYARRVDGAATTEHELLARGAYVLRRNKPRNKLPPRPDTQTIPLREQG